VFAFSSAELRGSKFRDCGKVGRGPIHESWVSLKVFTLQ